jgi:hypothetical protein
VYPEDVENEVRSVVVPLLLSLVTSEIVMPDGIFAGEALVKFQLGGGAVTVNAWVAVVAL